MPDLTTIDGLWAFLNSEFFKSLAGALAGAFAGAMAAQAMVDHSKRREQLLSQIRSTNVALMVAFNICNVALGLKKQHVNDLWTSYLEQKSQHAQFLGRLARGEVRKGEIFEFQLDLRTLQLPVFPINRLFTEVYERLSITGRPLSLLTALSDSITTLGNTIENRNRWIAQAQRLGPNGISPQLYFGLPLPDGSRDTLYADLMDALHRCVDDVIFFGSQLCNDIREYGSQTISKSSRYYRYSDERIHSTDFSESRVNGLMPDHEPYGDWFKNFPREPRPRLHALVAQLPFVRANEKGTLALSVTGYFVITSMAIVAAVTMLSP